MSYFVFDLETVVAPDMPALMTPDSGPVVSCQRIVAAGCVLLKDDCAVDSPRVWMSDERTIVDNLVATMSSERRTVVTFNGRGFDMPVIAYRCMHYGVQWPHLWGGRGMQFRYSDEGHFDLMDALSFHGATRKPALDAVAKLVGMPGKCGITGGDVAGLVESGEHEAVEAYVLSDAVQAAAILMRLKLTRGSLKPEQYRLAAASLVDLIDTDDRLEPLRAGIDRPRFLLEES